MANGTQRTVLESSHSHFEQFVRRFLRIPYESVVTFWAFALFWVLMAAAIPVAVVLQVFNPEHPKSAWNLFAEKIFRLYFYIAGVSLVLENTQYLPKNGDYAVFAANHASLIDGFLWGAVFNGRVFALTLPYAKMPWPIGLWLQKSGSIAVARTKEEQRRWPELVHGERAVRACVEKMQRRKKSLLIFPEGHIERQRKLLRFHTGAVRIALEIGRPIIPLTILHADRVFAPNRFIMWPGTIIFRLHEPMDLRQYYGKQGNHALVRRLTENLRRRITRDMPASYKD